MRFATIYTVVSLYNLFYLVFFYPTFELFFSHFSALYLRAFIEKFHKQKVSLKIIKKFLFFKFPPNKKTRKKNQASRIDYETFSICRIAKENRLIS